MGAQKLLLCECMGRTLCALLEDERAVELRFAPRDEGGCRVGDIYVGRIQRVLPNRLTAFVEIGGGTVCYYSLQRAETPIFTSKCGKKPFSEGDELLVQVQKEASKTKQPMVTVNLSFTGKYAVLTSGNRAFGISAKITGPRRTQLAELGQRYADRPFGVILRTNAREADDSVLSAEIERLAALYTQVTSYGTARTCYSRLYQAPGPCIQILRDCYQEELAEIVAECRPGAEDLYHQAKAYLRERQPEDLPKLRAYRDPDYPLAKCYSLEQAISEALREKVWLRSGAYLVIQPTEALTVIDVNSGKNQKKGTGFADINREAAREAARQIRLRNLGGIILIDFINLDSEEEQRALLHFLQKELSRDPNPGRVADMTALQLVEITRRKVRKTLEESLHG